MEQKITSVLHLNFSVKYDETCRFNARESIFTLQNRVHTIMTTFKDSHFLRQLGCKLVQAWNRTTKNKFSLPKFVKHSDLAQQGPPYPSPYPDICCQIVNFKSYQNLVKIFWDSKSWLVPIFRSAIWRSKSLKWMPYSFTKTTTSDFTWW